LLLHPTFAVLLPLAALIALHGAGIFAAGGLALSERFGQASFARAFGLINLAILPFMVASVPLAGHVYVRTGSYAGAVIGVIVFTLLGAVSAAMGRRANPMEAAAKSTAG
jgi:hypothetical protein